VVSFLFFFCRSLGLLLCTLSFVLLVETRPKLQVLVLSLLLELLLDLAWRLVVLVSTGLCSTLFFCIFHSCGLDLKGPEVFCCTDQASGSLIYLLHDISCLAIAKPSMMIKVHYLVIVVQSDTIHMVLLGHSRLRTR
jgi:hypothetical protein